MAKTRIPQKLQEWVEARRRYRLSDAHVQMARELGLNPRKLGKLDNHDQEPWKLPLQKFIAHLYEKRFGRQRPEVMLSIEELMKKMENKKALRRAKKAERRQATMAPTNSAASKLPCEPRESSGVANGGAIDGTPA